MGPPSGGLNSPLRMLVDLMILLFLLISSCFGEIIQTTEVFVMPIEPQLFNWTREGPEPHFHFRPSLASFPDLPHWLNYQFRKRDGVGFIYGVPPNKQKDFKIEVVGLNKKTYETRTKLIQMNVTEKEDPAKYEVHMKIDNLNVEDMFDIHRRTRLLKIFKSILWPHSNDDLHITFMDSAIKLGARLPLHPGEGEGVVVHLGSRVPFSDDLINLQDEVRPLWKMTHCPRDFKRTTVDRHFRPNGFMLDWCSFRLGEKEFGRGVPGNLQPQEGLDEDEAASLPQLSEVPTRTYMREMLAVLIAPFIAFLCFGLILSIAMCFVAEDLKHIKETESSSEHDEYNSILRATNTLRSMSHNRDAETSPRLNADLNEDVCRPSPPPYSASRKMFSETEPKTWYC